MQVLGFRHPVHGRWKEVERIPKRTLQRTLEETFGRGTCLKPLREDFRKPKPLKEPSKLEEGWSCSLVQKWFVGPARSRRRQCCLGVRDLYVWKKPLCSWSESPSICRVVVAACPSEGEVTPKPYMLKMIPRLITL